MKNDIEWKMVKLGEVCHIGDGLHGTPSNDDLGNFAFFINGNNLSNGIINLSNDTELVSESFFNKHKINFSKRTVFLSINGTIGNVALYSNEKIVLGKSVAYFNIFKDLETNFLYHFFQSDFAKKSFENLLTGTTIKNLGLKGVRALSIPIPYKNGSPDLETQKQIAQKLGDMDSLIAAKEKLLAKKRNLKVAAMQKLIKDKEDENWKKVKIGNYLRVKTGSKNTEDKIDDGKYPLYVRSPIVERINEYTYDCEAVLTAGDGVGTGKVFHYVNGKFAAHQRVYVISNFTEIDGKYFYYQFSQNFYDEVMKYTAKSSVDSVRRGMITGMEIALPFNSDGSPDLIEQRRIASILSNMDCEIAAIEKEITKLQKLKTAMMQKMFCFEDSDSSSE